MDPIKLKPAFKDYLWGGTRLREEYGKACDYDKVAESWELSCRPDGPSTVASGPDAGMPFPDWLNRYGPRVLGERAAVFPDFPILIKLIDAKDDLSVQVHPDDAYAQAHEGEFGKTEMWVVLDCEPGASLLYGFDHSISAEEFRRRIEDHTLMEVVNRVQVHPGDVFFIEARTLHAIGKGILIAEIQQNSNITYRISDYGRLGADGKPRELHLEQALAVTDRVRPKQSGRPQGNSVRREGYTETLLASCRYFTVSQLSIETDAKQQTDGSTFHALLCLSDGMTVCFGNQVLPLQKGETVFVPADAGVYTICGRGIVLRTTV
jgi:mannose-6-phosphate isomerase